MGRENLTPIETFNSANSLSLPNSDTQIINTAKNENAGQSVFLNSEICSTLNNKNSYISVQEDGNDEKESDNLNIFEKLANFFKKPSIFEKSLEENLVSIKDINDVNGEIDQDFKQGQIGDCVLLASLYSLSSTQKGQDIIKDAIKINYNEKGELESYDVYFRGYDKTYSIAHEELKEAEQLKYKFSKGEANHHYSTGDDDVLLIELAWVKACEDIEELQKENISNGNPNGPVALDGVTTYRFMKALAGASYSSSNVEYLNKLTDEQVAQQTPVIMDVLENQKEFKFEDIAFSNKKEHNFSYWINNEEKKFKLDREHAYIVEQKPSESENGEVTIINKETGEVLTIGTEKLIEGVASLPLNPENDRKMFDYDFENQINSDFVIGVVGSTSIEITDIEGNKINLPKMHAYGIKEITDSTVTFINPWNSNKEFTITKDELYNHDPKFGLSGYSTQE